MDRFTEEFKAIHASYRPRICRYLARLVGPGEAEDLSQEVFVRFSRALPDFRGDSKISTWIYRIATNVATDRLRCRSFKETRRDKANPHGEGSIQDKKKMRAWVAVLGIAFIIGASIAVSAPPEVSAGTPCCSITSIDMKTGIVTAKNTATGESFEFKLGNAAKIRNIKIGDQVSTDFQTREVTVHSFQPVDGILIMRPMPRPPMK